MYDLVPLDMNEVAKKLQWYQSIGTEKSESDVVQDSVLALCQVHLDEALEGSYWTAKWQVKNQELAILAANQVIGTIKAKNGSFEAEFRANSNQLIEDLRKQVEELVKNN